MDTEPLDAIVREMMLAVAQDLNLVALAMAAAIPAICASLAMESGRAKGGDYKAWCRENLKKGFEHITAEEIYSMRNGLLHQGIVELWNHNNRTGEMTPGDRYKRIVFVVDRTNIFTDSSGGDRYFYQVQEFCENMGWAATEWLAKQQDNPTVARNLDSMMRYRPFQVPGWNIEPPPRAIY